MLTIIHGEDITASRKYFISEKDKQASIVVFEPENIDMTTLTQEFAGGGGLFGEKKTVFLEGFISKKKTTKEFESLASYLAEQGKTNDIFFWEPKVVDATSLKLFKGASQKLFALPQMLFVFLDNLYPQNPNLLPLYHQVLENSEAEMIFSMIVRHIRIMLALSDSGNETIDEVKRMAPWQKGKLEKQQQKFTTKHLTDLLHKLYEIDKDAKTGNATFPLSSTIDFFLMEIYTFPTS